ncbi:MAG: SpoIIE family protein phosphatase, partial [Chloroflexi bacterium]|nr:SpoIIE family protein phosphatase [Chloroflexota bacterium]
LLLTTTISAGGLLLIIGWHGVFYREFSPDSYLILHTSIDFISIAVSFAIFAIGWYGYKQNHDYRNLFIALFFYAVGILDFVHSLSFVGMPDFLSPNTFSKAATFYVAARLIAAAGIFALVLAPAGPRPSRVNQYVLLAGVSALVGVLILIESYQPGYIPTMFVAGSGTTDFKSGIDYVIIALQVITVALLFKRPVLGAKPAFLLQVALIISIFSELAFTQDISAYDSYNFLSHAYKAIAYYFILRAVFVSSLQQPYAELKKTREDLEKSFGSIGAALTSSLELDKALGLIATLASDLLDSSHALVALMQDNGRMLSVRATRGLQNPPAELYLENNLAGLVWKMGTPVHISDLNALGQEYESMVAVEAGLRSAVAAPILKDKAFLGEITVYSRWPAAFDEDDAKLLAAFARQAGVAIENARLFESELSSRERMENYADQLAILHNISLQLNRETDTRRLLVTVLKGAMQLTDAGVGLMTLIDEGKTDVVSLHYADWYERRCEISGDLEHLHTRVARILGGRGRESMRIAQIHESDQKLGLPAGHLDLRGLLVGTILDTRGQVKGLFMLSDKANGERFTLQDEDIISLLAAQSSVALISAENFEREHYVAEALQSTLLPAVPQRDDVEIGLLYQSSGPYGKVGGDFYDFIELDGGRIAVVIGDVCGKGIEAAAFTAMIKYTLRAYLGEGFFPGDCLSKVNASIEDQLAPEKFITACLVIIDTKAGIINYSSAGHPPPIIARPGRASVVHAPSAVPLGVLPGQQYLSSQIKISDACQIVLYSDGLIEARPEGGDPFGEERAAIQLTDSCAHPAQQVADELVAAAVEYSGGKLKDDIALLIVKLKGQHQRVRRTGAGNREFGLNLAPDGKRVTLNLKEGRIPGCLKRRATRIWA